MTPDNDCTDLKNPQWVFHPEQDPSYHHFAHIGHAFEPDAASVTPANAAWLADAALLAYWPPAEVAERAAVVGLASEAFSAGGTDGYVITSPVGKWGIIAFRGTQPDQFEDIASDADFQHAVFDGGSVHRGFLRALGRVKDHVGERVRALTGAGFRVWFCGHSLGAALATLAAVEFRQHATGICTLGSPRVGNPRFVDAFNERFGRQSARYVHDHDIVARVPPPELGLLLHGGYRHVGELRFIDANGAILSDPAEEPSFFADVLGHPLQLRIMFATFRPIALGGGAPTLGGTHISPAALLPQSIVDHMPKAYACAIRSEALRSRNGAQ